jgi:RNA polymerase sigma-70 factor (ECF subfamily)
VGAYQAAEGVDDLVAIYPQALPQVYGYLVQRCGSVVAAEDLTAETFMAAVEALERGMAPTLTVAWLIGVARHKLVDYWRRADRERRNLGVAATSYYEVDDPWPAVVDVDAVHVALARLSAPHRAALTLRYLDGLSVAEVAEDVGRSLPATETLLARARAALRGIYQEDHGDDR